MMWICNCTIWLWEAKYASYQHGFKHMRWLTDNMGVTWVNIDEDNDILRSITSSRETSTCLDSGCFKQSWLHPNQTKTTPFLWSKICVMWLITKAINHPQFIIIWEGPKIGVPPVIIHVRFHFRLTFSHYERSWNGGIFQESPIPGKPHWSGFEKIPPFGVSGAVEQSGCRQPREAETNHWGHPFSAEARVSWRVMENS